MEANFYGNVSQPVQERYYPDVRYWWAYLSDMVSIGQRAGFRPLGGIDSFEGGLRLQPSMGPVPAARFALLLYHQGIATVNSLQEKRVVYGRAFSNIANNQAACMIFWRMFVRYFGDAEQVMPAPHFAAGNGPASVL